MNISYGSYSLLNAIYYVAPQIDLFAKSDNYLTSQHYLYDVYPMNNN
jgi:hypothetical protein